ncbi:MAG: AI-2E family transporter [Gemmatimonadales bacterium]|nr:AI-2E family transporter [Gemmatimonadales bacterium]
MSFLDDKRTRAAALILVLGAGLAVALWPFATGLIGGPVLYVVFAPLHRWMARRIPAAAAAGIALVLALGLIVGPGLSLVSLIAAEAPQIAANLQGSTLLARLQGMHVAGVDVGAQLKTIGERAAGLLGSSALSLVSAATDLTVSVTIALFGLYYMLAAPEGTWHAVQPYIPFSAENSERLRRRFHDVTVSTLLGTFLTASLQGVLVAVAFKATGLKNAGLWGVTTAVLSILPLVGSGLVWVPGVVTLALQGKYPQAIGLAAWSVLLVTNVDNVIRPWVFSRYASLHPFTTVIGAFAGIQYFGLLGLLVGPLAISYFFELIVMYRAEYLGDAEAVAEVTGELRAVRPPGMPAAAAADPLSAPD